MPGVELADVTKRFGAVSAVDDVSLAVPTGELLVLVGPSGCGKTTLLRLIAGLERPDDGEVYVDDRRVTDLPARKRDVSLVFQDFALFPHLSARENISFDLRMQGYDEVDRRVREAATLLDVTELLDRSIDALSGGQKQRVALGRAIVTEPSAFLLDEPLANLDANLRERMQTEITRLQDHLGVTTVHVTHDQAEALRMGDRVAVMSDGRVEQVGTPEAVYRSPATLFVARFVGNPTMNLFRGRLERRDGSATVVSTDGDLVIPVPEPKSEGMQDPGAEGERDPVVESAREPTPGSERETDRPPSAAGAADGRPVVLGVRPEDVEVAGTARTADDAVQATVQFDTFQGADRFVYLEGAGGSEFVARVPGTSAVEAGREVAVSLAGGRVHLFDAGNGERIPVVEGDARAPSASERTDGGGS